MATSPKTYGFFCDLLRDELAQLRDLNVGLSERDGLHFRDLTKKCGQCDRVFDIEKNFLANKLFKDDDSVLVVADLENLRQSIRCECGAEFSAEPDVRRSPSEINEQRRELFDACAKKISENTTLNAVQSHLLTRYLFRFEIVKGVQSSK